MMRTKFDLNEILNSECRTGCNKQDRQENTDDGICTQTTSVTDHLPVRCVGEWSYDKIFLLNQYFGIFSVGMKDAWEGRINYIEICSGPGRCINRSNGNEFDGTALCIVKHNAFRHMKMALFFDINELVVTTLNQRFTNLQIPNAKAYRGDYYNSEEVCARIKTEIDPSGLNIIFIDPTDCSVPFAFIHDIKAILPKSDLIINVASHTDFNRNVGNALLNPTAYETSINKYEMFLDNDHSFFNDPANFKLAQDGNFIALRHKFRELYLQKLRTLGYAYFDYQAVGRFYDILYASQHKIGLELWKKAVKNEFDGQMGLGL
jgi:three-Cys-motif partner protein